MSGRADRAPRVHPPIRDVEPGGFWPQPNYDPADLASNGTRLAAKCSAFFGSGSCHVSVFSESVFELLRFDVGTDLDGECVLGNWA